LRLLCLFGLHRRSGRTVKRVQDGWIGKCDGCGILLQRRTNGRWSKATAEQISAAERYRTKK
jgi:hypothetical protein